MQGIVAGRGNRFQVCGIWLQTCCSHFFAFSDEYVNTPAAMTRDDASRTKIASDLFLTCHFYFFIKSSIFFASITYSTITKNGKKGRAVRRNIIITNTDINNGKLYVYHTAEFWYADRLFYMHFASGIPER